MRRIYSDESTFSEPRACIGVGMLISDSNSFETLIITAMKNLINDEDRFKEPAKSLDDRTIERGFFHASEDSKNAHSHLCTQINTISNAEFVCDFFDKSKLPKHEQYDGYLYRRATILSSVNATYTTDELKFYFENREDVTIDSLRGLYHELEENSLLGIYDLPFIPHFFPKVDFEIVDKTNAGMQCGDFILWTVNRFVNGDRVWFERITSPMKTGFSSESGSWGGQHVKLGTGLRDPVVYYTVTDLPIDPDRAINRNLYINFYLRAAKIIEYYLNNPSPHIAHLLDEIKEAVISKKNLGDYEYFDKLSSSYLKLFDMAPVINQSTSNSDKTFLLLSKKYVSLLMRKDLLYGVRTRMWLEDVRRHIVRNEPNLLDF